MERFFVAKCFVANFLVPNGVYRESGVSLISERHHMSSTAFWLQSTGYIIFVVAILGQYRG